MSLNFDLPLEPQFWAGIILCGLLASTAFISSTTSGNFSFVDRIWSISPIFYTWILASRSFTPKTVLMALWVTAWGTRLTYNFYRRGGYEQGSEDYRWPVLRTIITSKPLLLLFNLTFISSYQNFLLFLLTLPVYVASLDSNSSLSPTEMVYGALLFICLVGETIADQQQWAFQEKKYELIKIHKSIDKIKFPYRYGFCTKGMFRYSRHPNFFFEVSQWIIFGLFGINASVERGYWVYTFIGPFLLTTLFMGSTWFTESISSKKYPLYKLYQAQVSALIPMPASRFQPSLETVEEYERTAANIPPTNSGVQKNLKVE